ncbi:MAG: peptidoglycan-associated lipoprotein Pal [Bacteriovoracaceae bacterium]
MKAISQNSLMILLAVFALSMSGCASKAKKADGSASESVVDDTATDNPLELNGTSDDNTAGGLQTIYFDFDSSRLTSAARNTLERNADFLKENDNVDIQIEGHADERGGEQYNLALGERRARSVKDYLTALGVDGNRISIISFGKTTPKAFGHNEQAWSQNRRANFVITAK